MANRIKPKLTDKIRGDRSSERSAFCDRWKLSGEPRSGRLDHKLIPVLIAKVHEVHTRAVAGIDRCILTGQNRAQEGTDQVNDSGLLVVRRIDLRETSYLRSSEALDHDRSCARADFVVSADRLSDFRAFFGRGSIHPDG